MKTFLILVSLLGALSSFACDNNLCKGDRVNFGTHTGTAIEVFSNGKVQIDVDGYIGYLNRRVSELGKGVHCNQKLCVNDRVYFESHVGTAKEVFSNGKVKIDVDGYTGYTFRKVGQLGIGFRCSGNLCVNDRVYFESHVGTAKEVFSNGEVKIDVDGYTGYTFRKVGQLGYELRCYN
jgi:hypothetical protein